MGNQDLVLVDEVTQQIAENLSESEKEIKINHLASLENEIKSGLSDSTKLIHNMMFSSQKEIFAFWSVTLEQLHYLGKYEKPLNTISTYIQKQIGRMQLDEDPARDLDKKENMCRNVRRSLDPKFKEESDGQIVRKITSELNEEQQFICDTFASLEQFYSWMGKICKTMKEHMKDPNMNDDMKKYFDKFHKIAALREPIEFMMDEGSVLDQIADEQNIREVATVLQRAIVKSLDSTISYRQAAHFYGTSTRQNQRIRERDEDWPAKDIESVIRHNILSYCCQSCGMNIITGKKYDKNGTQTGMVKLKHKLYPIPEKYKGSPLSPIQIAMEMAKK